MKSLITTASERKRPFFPQIALVWRIIFGTLFVITLLLGGFTTLKPVVVLPRITLAPGFNLVDQTGAQISNEQVRGGIALYNFTYSGCIDDCPQTTPLMAEVQARVAQLETGGIPVKLVTISIDPEHDTVEQLAAYADAHNADPDIWRFATGSPMQIKSVIGGGFSTYYTEKEGKIKFDPAFMLVDGNGILRAEYRTAVPDTAIILRDINLLVEEAHNSTGPQKLAYEAAHLFLCYPD
ncbi:MAG: SCO family protein [Anaerolineae bacterium]|nr:SCO family protein [Anaerolineae bacterium]